MYREFGLVSIRTSLIEQRIRIEFTLDVDPDTATLDTLALSEKETGRIIPMDILVDKKTIQLALKEWPKAETEYLLRIQSSGIRSIVDDELPDSILRTLVFQSEVLSTVDILTPSHHEELTELFISWRENSVDGKESSLVSSYYLEIAKENAFYNIVRQTEVVDKKEIKLTDIEPGQYYARIRAQKNKEYGRWSETITFLVIEKKEALTEEEQDEPIFERPLRLISQPENGVTPTSFILVFDEDIDIDLLPTIKLKRRPV